MRIANVDTLSALLDRLIVEHIKRFFFAKDGLREKVRLQDQSIAGIRERISDLFRDSMRTGRYEFLPEQRSFVTEALTMELEELILHNIETGEADRAKLAELESGNPRFDRVVLQELQARKAVEARAANKNNIDQILQSMVDCG